MPESCSNKVGGQAVIEGVMMRSPRSFAVAIRRPNGEIAVREQVWHSLWERLRALRWPFLRGAVVLGESLHNGFTALHFSAAEAAAHAAENPEGSKATDKPSADASGASPTALRFTMLIAVVLAVAVFVALPHALVWLLGTLTGSAALSDGQSLPFHAVDGAIKMAIFVVYLWAIGRLPDIRRVFMYHGAEHKAIATLERGLPLDVAHARAQSRFHPRCGTSFLLLAILVSIAVFAIVFPLLPAPTGRRWLDQVLFVLIKLPLLLPIAGLAYEAIRLGDRLGHTPFGRWLVAPGLWLQRLTTREPGDGEIEVALVALRKTLWREQLGRAADESRAAPEVFTNFEEFQLRVP